VVGLFSISLCSRKWGSQPEWPTLAVSRIDTKTKKKQKNLFQKGNNAELTPNGVVLNRTDAKIF
jgi:hypothetical protein